jgi:precorrin-4/cobalt-precorrin-4 C11-methyltransferase
MKVYFIGAGPGDPELLTLKALKIIEQAPYCIYAGSLINPEILRYTPPGAKLMNSAKMSVEEIIGAIKEARDQDKDVARLHSGDPFIYGAIQEQLQQLEALTIAYELIPGISSFQAAAAALQQELTLPGVSQTVILTRKGKKTPVPPKESLSQLGMSGATMYIFLSIDQIDSIVEELIPYYGPDCPAAMIYKASWPEQKIIRAPLSELATKVKASGIDRTALILVGRVLEKKFARSHLYTESPPP